MKTVYVDNAASTPIRHEVSSAIIESFEHYGNPSCIHGMGQKASDLIDNARNQIAKSINAKPEEIIFTSGGTESNNLAILGFVNANNYGNHIITTAIEHVSVLNPIRQLYCDGYDVTYLPVDKEGFINLTQLERAIHRDTIFISVMFANNEIGTIQPIQEIGAISRKYNICFHVDAVQGLGHYDIDVAALGIDMMSISGHKIYGPKGIGALYIKNDIELQPLLFGGGQEFNLRSGTENVSGIVGMGKAAELIRTDRRDLSALRFKLIDGIISKIPYAKFNGSLENSLPSIVNFSFDGIDGATLVKQLSEHGIYASTGSACTTSTLYPSHVLTAIGVPDDLAYGSIRFSLGMYNTEDDIDYILSVLPDIVKQK